MSCDSPAGCYANRQRTRRKSALLQSAGLASILAKFGSVLMAMRSRIMMTPGRELGELIKSD